MVERLLHPPLQLWFGGQTSSMCRHKPPPETIPYSLTDTPSAFFLASANQEMFPLFVFHCQQFCTQRLKPCKLISLRPCSCFTEVKAAQLILADPSLVCFAAMSTNTVISHQKLRLKPAFFCPKTSKYAQGAIVSEKVIARRSLSYPLIQ